MTLKQKAQELLINRPVWLTYEIIERETGIPTGWLNALKRGKMKQPKKDRLEILINYFKKTLHAD